MKFIPGLKLSELFFEQAVQPLLMEHFPDLSYSAARLDRGSEILGLDTSMSMDHGWGPKLTLFISATDFNQYSQILDEFFANNLPFDIEGFPTHFSSPQIDGGKMGFKDTHPICHMVKFNTVEHFFASSLGVDLHEQLTPAIWLTIPRQHLRLIRSGRIYHDGLGTLESTRTRFNWYPEDLWRYLLANQWNRIDQDMPFIGRTGSVDDELGSHLLGTRIITDLMNLAFLMEKQYAPYRKWFGTAFQNLKLSQNLNPCFQAVLESVDWKTREAHLSDAFRHAIEAHNALNLTEEIPAQVHAFYDRPFLVPPAGKIAEALLDGIKDPAIKSLPSHLGSVDQISDATDVLDDIPICKKLRVLYQ